MGAYLEAILLGLLQGLTEFLPISSSGHVAIGMELLGWEDPEGNLAFTVAVHLGSLAAVLVFSRRELKAMFTTRPRLLLVTVLATLPVGVIGILAKDLVGELATNMLAVGSFLCVTGAILLVGRQRDRGAGRAPDLPWLRAVGIGLAQAVAILPGVSRSGSTLAAGLVAGLERGEAVRFAFLLAAPAIGGAGLLTALGGGWNEHTAWGPLVAGTAVSFAASLVAMWAMVGVVARRKLGWFALYCFAVGLFALGLGLWA